MSELKRSLNLPLLIFYGTGMILGAGIYSVIGKAAGEANESLWISLLIAAFTVILTALSYAELSVMFPKAGAEYTFISEAFKKHQWIGSTIGATVAFSSAATATTVAIAFAGYFAQFYSVSQVLISVAILLVFTLLAIWGIRESAWANVIFTLIEVSGLGIIIYFGFQNEKFGEILSSTPHMGTLSGAALIVFSFFGFENIVTLSEEVEDPKRTIPLAIFISIGISTVLYLLVCFSALSLIPIDKLAESSAPLMTVAQSISPHMGKTLGIVALFSTANTVLISLISSSRILFSMAESKVLPKVLSKITPKRKTPWIASLGVLFVSLLLLTLGELEVVASITSLTTMVAFCMVNTAVIALRFSDPKKQRRFKIPLSIGKWPLLPVLGLASCVVFLTQFTSQAYIVSFIAIAAFAIAFIVKR